MKKKFSLFGKTLMMLFLMCLVSGSAFAEGKRFVISMPTNQVTQILTNAEPVLKVKATWSGTAADNLDKDKVSIVCGDDRVIDVTDAKLGDDGYWLLTLAENDYFTGKSVNYQKATVKFEAGAWTLGSYTSYADASTLENVVTIYDYPVFTWKTSEKYNEGKDYQKYEGTQEIVLNIAVTGHKSGVALTASAKKNMKATIKGTNYAGNAVKLSYAISGTKFSTDKNFVEDDQATAYTLTVPEKAFEVTYADNDKFKPAFDSPALTDGTIEVWATPTFNKSDDLTFNASQTSFQFTLTGVPSPKTAEAGKGLTYVAGEGTTMTAATTGSTTLGNDKFIISSNGEDPAIITVALKNGYTFASATDCKVYIPEGAFTVNGKKNGEMTFNAYPKSVVWGNITAAEPLADCGPNTKTLQVKIPATLGEGENAPVAPVEFVSGSKVTVNYNNAVGTEISEEYSATITDNVMTVNLKNSLAGMTQTKISIPATALTSGGTACTHADYDNITITVAPYITYPTSTSGVEFSNVDTESSSFQVKLDVKHNGEAVNNYTFYDYQSTTAEANYTKADPAYGANPKDLGLWTNSGSNYSKTTDLVTNKTYYKKTDGTYTQATPVICPAAEGWYQLKANSTTEYEATTDLTVVKDKKYYTDGTNGSEVAAAAKIISTNTNLGNYNKYYSGDATSNPTKEGKVAGYKEEAADRTLYYTKSGADTYTPATGVFSYSTTYYIKSVSTYSAVLGPKAAGFYEQTATSPATYKATDDTKFDGSKSYYTRSGEEGSYSYNEVTPANGSYYELNSYTTAATLANLKQSIDSKFGIKTQYYTRNTDKIITVDDMEVTVSAPDNTTGLVTVTLPTGTTLSGAKHTLNIPAKVILVSDGSLNACNDNERISAEFVVADHVTVYATPDLTKADKITFNLTAKNDESDDEVAISENNVQYVGFGSSSTKYVLATPSADKKSLTVAITTGTATTSTIDNKTVYSALTLTEVAAFNGESYTIAENKIKANYSYNAALTGSLTAATFVAATVGQSLSTAAGIVEYDINVAGSTKIKLGDASKIAFSQTLNSVTSTVYATYSDVDAVAGTIRVKTNQALSTTASYTVTLNPGAIIALNADGKDLTTNFAQRAVSFSCTAAPEFYDATVATTEHSLTTDADVTAGINDRVIFNRAFKNSNYQAYYMPYSIPVAQLNEAGLDIYRIVSTSEGTDPSTGAEISKFLVEKVTPETVTRPEVKDQNGTITQTEDKGTIWAYKPYIIKADAAGTKRVILKNVTGVKYSSEGSVSSSSTLETYTFTGNHIAIEESGLDGKYYLDKGLLTKEGAKATAYAWRWYMTTTRNNISYAKIVVDGEDENTTAIESVDVENNANVANDAIYNIAGQRISQMSKGINIVNGKKVLVK